MPFMRFGFVTFSKQHFIQYYIRTLKSACGQPGIRLTSNIVPLTSRSNNPASVYCEDTTSGRLSLLLPLEDAALIKFMCRGSDLGGPARRPIQVIFTLEDRAGQTMGRDTTEVRVCSCPTRDLATEEHRRGPGPGPARR